MSLFRPWRRKVKPLGTVGGNPSEVDEVLAAGPPVDLQSGLPNFGLHALEQSAAVEGDLVRDMSSDFDAEEESEDKTWRALGRRDDEDA